MRSAEFPLEKVAHLLFLDPRVLRGLVPRSKLKSEAAIAPFVPDLAAPESFAIPESIEVEDLVRNDGKWYRGFQCCGDFGDYPIDVSGLGPVYWADAMEHDRMGYFLDLDDAVAAVSFNWNDGLRRRVTGKSSAFKTPGVVATVRARRALAAAASAPGPLDVSTLRRPELLPGSGLHVRSECPTDAELCADLLLRYVEGGGDSTADLIWLLPPGVDTAGALAKRRGGKPFIAALRKTADAAVRKAREAQRRAQGLARMDFRDGGWSAVLVALSR